MRTAELGHSEKPGPGQYTDKTAELEINPGRGLLPGGRTLVQPVPDPAFNPQHKEVNPNLGTFEATRNANLEWCPLNYARVPNYRVPSRYQIFKVQVVTNVISIFQMRDAIYRTHVAF